MSEDSNKDKKQVEELIDDDYNSDEDPFSQFLTEDLEQCAFFTDSFCDQFLPRTTQILLEYNSGKWVPRLREPRDLYGLSPAGHLHLVRWPHQYEVIRDRIEHIEWVPPHPEPLYIPSGLEAEPLCPEPSEGAVVYLADEADKDSSFMCSRIGGSCPSKQVLPQSWDDWDNTLIFEARFESGNLQKVVKISDFEYQLTLRTDLYTKKHTQWYYFQVTNTQAGIPYRFTIVNFTKPTSLYNRGMRPLLYSEAEAKIHKVGWQRTGDEIKYFKNNLSQDGHHQYFSLTWTFQFPHDRDTCYFAHCYPYTYSNLQDYLSAIAGDPKRSMFCKIRILCHSLARNIVYVLTITNPLQDFQEEKRKAAVILTARVHPGETNSSWMMKGFLDYILGDSKSAQLLRDTYIFKVVPMLNPDGVIVGNYRCSLAGRDLNRNYKSDLKDSFPSIWYTRSMIKRIMDERRVLLYCDLHGHSRKENVFMYGCEKREQQEEGASFHQRVFPLIMSKNCPDKFSFSDCSFKIQKSKEGTGRVVMWKMGISNSYTLEVTFCGSKLAPVRHRSRDFFVCDSAPPSLSLSFQEETMQLKFQQALVKHSTEPWWQKYKRCLVYLSHLALEAGYIALLFYALVWEVGDIVRLPTKIIGFFNFCLWDKEDGKLDCLALGDLEKMGVFTVGLMLSRVLVYVTPVLCLFVATTTLQAQCLKDRDIWKFARYLLIIGSIILPIGVALFLYHTRKWIQISEYGTVFVTLLGAMVLMLLHLIIIVLYLARFKDPLPKGEVCPAKSLP
ncbi:hypothetical protein JRQ81_016143 [Phrynocephalus forsythii]|uniref:Peptidase M14 domain-containing protein n=1 Tax=Phrynocephalus forsythii TaxID=171643 RepID=A0A9Q0XX74_9SAUR|nr:hypothetical protein JRQ81_016143 [Phrynocephalus forsythii]